MLRELDVQLELDDHRDSAPLAAPRGNEPGSPLRLRRAVDRPAPVEHSLTNEDTTFRHKMTTSTIVIVLLVVALVVLLIRDERRERKRHDRELEHETYKAMYTCTEEEKTKARAESRELSRTSILGQVGQHLAPYMPEMIERFDPGDWRFLGSPIDFIIFDGLSAGAVKRIVVVEVKTTNRKRGLTDREAQIKRGIDAGAITLEFDVLRMGEPSTRAAARTGPVHVASAPDEVSQRLLDPLPKRPSDAVPQPTAALDAAPSGADQDGALIGEP